MVKLENSRETLKVVVDERVIELLCRLFAGRSHNAVLWEEGELTASGGV
jgi:hypothetical protein